MSPTSSPIVPSRTRRSSHVPSVIVTKPAVLLDSSPTPNVVIIKLATTIEIPDYNRFYSSAINSFRPTYSALPDGSLVTPPLISDIRTANSWLLVYATIGTFCLLNTITSFRYVRKGQVKNKFLFYLLLCSQILGLAAIIPMIIPYFSQSVSCTAVGLVFRVAISLSYSLLMTGILGIKAYRCLNSSRIVLTVLITLRMAMLALLGVDASSYRGLRRLSGSCQPSEQSKILPIIIILQSAEALFICGCFLVAVWLASRSPLNHGRLSIQVSTTGNSLSPSQQKTRRGWWDYVPDGNPSGVLRAGSPTYSQEALRRPSLFTTFGGKLWSLCPLSDTTSATVVQEKASPSEDHYANRSRPTRTSSVVFADVTSAPDRSPTARVADLTRIRATTPVPRPPSAISRISKYMPRMKLFRRVLRDELLYTAFTTAIFLVTGIVMLVGVTCNFLLGPLGWLIFNWVIVSAFTMNSFSRVVRRHEREAVLQHPSAWDPMYRAELEASRVFQQGLSRRTFSSVSVISRRPRRRDWSSSSGPYQDLHNHSSLYSPAVTERPSSGPSHAGSRPWQTASQFSRTSVSMSCMSPSPSVEHIPVPSHWNDTVILPSPGMAEFSVPPSAECLDVPSDTERITRHPQTPTSSTLTSLHYTNKLRPSFDSRKSPGGVD
ncbi:unnamed protein product [Somion occarium]|uniref:Uncharacterized protein n=1 Tax=Somion occarium TaxID=3059160 RepID=A0ABP1CK79_9APHY